MHRLKMYSFYRFIILLLVCSLFIVVYCNRYVLEDFHTVIFTLLIGNPCAITKTPRRIRCRSMKGII